MRLSSRYGKGVRPPSETAEAAMDVDVTPVMNLFIVMIPFLVTMAVFTHVFVIDFGVPPNVAANLDKSQGKPKLRLTVIVAPEFVALTRGEEMLDSIWAAGGEFDRDTLKARLGRRREEVDIRDEVVVAVRDQVRFEHVVKVMDACRESGFAKLGLSSATEKSP